LFSGVAWTIPVQIYHFRLWQLLGVSSDKLGRERVAIVAIVAIALAFVPVQSDCYPSIRYISKGLCWTLAPLIRIELALAIMAKAMLAGGRPHVANMAFANLSICHASPPYLVLFCRCNYSNCCLCCLMNSNRRSSSATICQPSLP